MSFFSLSLFSTFFRFIPACGCPTTYEITTTKTILIWGAKKFRCCIGILTTVVARYHPSHHIHRLHRSIVFCRHRCRYTHFLPPYHHNKIAHMQTYGWHAFCIQLLLMWRCGLFAMRFNPVHSLVM